jgi:hypothetical protein
MVNLTVGPEPKNMKFGIVDPEVNYDAGSCVNQPKGCKVETLSCRYLNALPTSIINPVCLLTDDYFKTLILSNIPSVHPLDISRII